MKVTIDLPDDLLGALPFPVEDAAREVLIAAAIHWWTQAWISQGRAAEVAGMGRAEFMDLLTARNLALLNWDEDEYEREFAHVRSRVQDRECRPDHLPKPSGVAGVS